MDLFLQRFFLISYIQTLLSLIVLFGIFGILFVLREKLSFSKRMFLGLLLGACLGVALQYFANFPQGGVTEAQSSIELHWFFETYTWLNFFAQLFVSLLKLLIVPIVFVGVLYVMITLSADVKLPSLFGRSLFWLLLSTGCASAIGVTLAYYTDLGLGMMIENGVKQAREVQSFNQILLGLMPNNIVTSMSSNAVVGIVLFALIFAISARSVGASHRGYESFVALVEFFHSVMMKTAMLIIYLMPYAIVVMIAGIFMRYGFASLQPVLLFIALIYVSALLVFVMHAVILMLHGLNPLHYFRKALPALITAFTSRSSLAILPLSIQTLQGKMGVSSVSSSFVPTLGVTIGANGCAGYFGGLVGVFAYNALGIEIGLTQGVMIVILSVVASIGIAGIPGIATMAASIVLTGLGLGEYFGILAVILAIDPVIDMARTMSNVSGAMVASIATDKEMGTLDTEAYRA
ncbi:hypothetical protein BBW65_03010 [Helicobacter enhydrae]|uniref:Sodium:dicarboxylate symporter n=1 Tax=Helicobacter enhydrae TaxID=222136 RepID=A0A1B1U4V8_9HELI|nr:cation:dicarboxylase symporter family transporter [Helicobacter enhydrae]ANV97834.1 hypothetical protein BBW65_03010 [Helicobacter enhydrae]